MSSSNNHHLNIVHFNARSIRIKEKQIELINEIHNKNIDILLLSETWFNDTDTWNIKNFKC